MITLFRLPDSRRQQVFLLIILISVLLLASSFYHVDYVKKLSSALSFSGAVSPLSFCPTTVRKYVPTVILQSTGMHTPHSNRTHWVDGKLAGFASQDAATFLPRVHPESELRFALNIPAQHMPASLNEFAEPGIDERSTPDDALEGDAELCQLFTPVPSSPLPALPPGWSHSSVMFGMATLPDRALWNLRVWEHWLPTAPSSVTRPLDYSNQSITSQLPLVYISTPPDLDEAQRKTQKEAVREAQARGMLIKFEDREAERFETRVLALVETMWNEARRREYREGIVTEWFVIADDDTFIPDFTGLARMLGSYNSSADILLGDLSETPNQVGAWGHMAFGGAGVFLSRGLVAKMNGPGMWADCLEKFHHIFGGDAMTSLCAAHALGTDIPSIMHVDDTLHQMDFRDDVSGFFQSGFLITTLHHWASWFWLFPAWHPTIRDRDLRDSILLVGKLAKAIGGDNWLRRYVFEDGKVVVHLGYSIVIYANSQTPEDLAASEKTWGGPNTWHPCRDALVEGTDKRTYYLFRSSELSPGVMLLEHENQEGERVDIVWDGRADHARQRFLPWPIAPILPNQGHRRSLVERNF